MDHGTPGSVTNPELILERVGNFTIPALYRPVLWSTAPSILECTNCSLGQTSREKDSIKITIN
jgi:hypothetical protein